MMDSNGSDALNWTNATDYHCFADNDTVCFMLKEEKIKRDAIAITRLVIACLSLVGALSIIITAIGRRQIRSPKVFPLFIISIADCLLSLSWVVGGIMWLADISQRTWCFAPSLFTIVLVCVSANLHCVYALFSYSSIKHRDFSRMLTNMDQSNTERVWHPCKTFIAYATAWILPVLIFGTSVVVLEEVEGLVSMAHECTCWCVPYFGNVLPFSFGNDPGLSLYFTEIRKLVAFYGLVVGTNFLVVLLLLFVIYWKIMRWIKNLRERNNVLTRNQPHYGAVDGLIVKGQVQARKRIIYFMLNFIFTGIINLFVSYVFVVFESLKIKGGPTVHMGHDDHLTAFPLTLYLLQSLTLPLQGFLNALVYGWTKEDFVEVITHRRINSESEKPREAETDSDLDLSVSIQLSTDYSSSSILAGRASRDSKPAAKSRLFRGTGINRS